MRRSYERQCESATNIRGFDGGAGAGAAQAARLAEEEKERLIAETLLPGANVSAIARAEGLDPSQL